MEHLLMKVVFVCLLSVFLFVPAYVTSQLTPDDEGSDVFNEFLALLEDKTGLSNLIPNYTIDGIINCGSVSQCTVNPQGDLIWDIRYTLYETHMMQGADEESKTLDGCLKDSNSASVPNNDTYNDCMETVRTSMRDFLNNKFGSLLISEINNNCSLIDANCV